MRTLPPVPVDPKLLYERSVFLGAVVLFSVDSGNDCATTFSYTFDKGERMVFIVYLTETTVGHVFTELEHLIEFIKAGTRHHRVEIWNKGVRKALHI